MSKNKKSKNDSNKKIQELLQRYNVNISLEKANKITIIEVTENHIKYHDAETNEIITSYLKCYIPDKLHPNQDLIGLIINNPEETYFTEYYINPQDADKKNILLSIMNPDTRTFARTYIDIETKYGDFCLHIEEGKRKEYGPYKQVSLYHGNHTQAMYERTNIDGWMKDFNFPKSCIVRQKYCENDHFNQWMFGYKKNMFSNPNINVYNFDCSKFNGRIIECPIYTYQIPASYYSGTILIDGTLKMEENKERISDTYQIYDIKKQIEEYENSEYTSKAYFYNVIECMAILKKGYTITIELKQKNRRTEKWEKVQTINITSNTDKEFTNDDFNLIRSQLPMLNIDNMDKKFIQEQIIGYILLHEENNFYKLDSKYTLEDKSYDSILEYIRQQNISELVEKTLEELSRIFDIPIEEILGQTEQLQDEKIEFKKRKKKKK